MKASHLWFLLMLTAFGSVAFMVYQTVTEPFPTIDWFVYSLATLETLTGLLCGWAAVHLKRQGY